MRKFAANYLVTDKGVFLKNGIAIVGEDGFIVQYIDTKGDLREMERLIFYNGILMAATKLTKTNSSQTEGSSDASLRSLVIKSIAESTQLSIQNLIDLGKQVQIQYPKLNIAVIMNEIVGVLLGEGKFTKDTIPGIYLLSGADLVGMHFTPKSRLKQII